MYESTYITGREEGWEEGRQEGRQEGEIIGEERGVKIGATEKAYNSAEIMMRNGESDEKIALYTGLTIEQVRELRRKLGL